MTNFRPWKGDRFEKHNGMGLPSRVLSEGMSVAAAAQKLGVSRTALSRVLNGHASISVALALKLEAAGCGNPQTGRPD